MEDIVKVLNNLIEAASENAADAGGSYNQALSKLYDAIEDAIFKFNLNTEYDIIETFNINCYAPFKIGAENNE